MTVPLKFKCPSCGNPASAPSEMAGQKVRCSKCGQKIRLPAAPRAMTENDQAIAASVIGQEWREAPASGPVPSSQYTCASCGGQFGGDDVYDQHGILICKSCFGNQSLEAAATMAASGSAVAASGRAGRVGPSRFTGWIIAAVVLAAAVGGAVWAVKSTQPRQVATSHPNAEPPRPQVTSTPNREIVNAPKSPEPAKQTPAPSFPAPHASAVSSAELGPATQPAPVATAPVTSPTVTWEQQNRGQIEQLLRQVDLKLANNDKFGAALAYRRLFDLIGGHLPEIQDPALNQRLTEAASSRGKLLVQVKSSPQAVAFTADSLLSSGLAALNQQRWEAALESLSDVRQLIERNSKPFDRAKDPRYLRDLHALAVAYLQTGRTARAGELFSETAPLSRQIEQSPTRELVINRAVTDITQRTSAVRAAKTIKEYLDKHPDQADEQMLNLLLTAIDVGQQHTAAKTFLNQLGDYYQKRNEQLEKAHGGGEKRWGVEWLSAAEVDQKFEEQKRAIVQARKLEQQRDAAFGQWERQKQLYIPQGPQRIRYTTKANVDAAERRYNELAAAASEAESKIPIPPCLTELHPVMPEPPPTALASAQPTPGEADSSTAVAPMPSESAGTTSDQGVSSEPEPAPTPSAKVAVQRYALAFAIDRLRLITSAQVLSDATAARIEDGQGAVLTAKVIERDERLALLEVGASEVPGGALHYLNLADSFAGGAVKCAAIPEANIFGPSSKLLAGETAPPPMQGTWTASLSEHPRLAGAPLLDARGNVVGVVVAGRDDPRTKLPAVSLRELREFLAAHDALPQSPCPTPDPTHMFQATIQEQ